ncbi:MAG: hypothetical protein KGJ60_07575 [Verrucomicrobiota bacterium]|nr:hypothetical protein [Verrucomicrobiota bacterium]
MSQLFPSRSIARRLQLSVGVAAGLVLGLTVWFNYRVSRDELARQTNAKAVAEVGAAARRLDDFILRIGMLPRDIAIRQQAYGRDPDPGMVPYLRELLRETPVDQVYGVYIAYDDKNWKDPSACLAVHRTHWPALTPVEYDYHDPKQEWYNGPKVTRAFHVTEPYFDEGAGNISMVSLTVPVFDQASNFIGVAGADLALDRIREMVRSVSLAESGRGGTNVFAYLASRNGRIIAHPDEALMFRKGFSGADLTSRPGGELVAAKSEGSATTIREWRTPADLLGDFAGERLENRAHYSRSRDSQPRAATDTVVGAGGLGRLAGAGLPGHRHFTAIHPPPQRPDPNCRRH